ncbi:MAG: hypothetical protein ACQER4_08570 [Bacteroidota bacterium]
MLETISQLLTKVFGTKSERDLKKIWPIVEQIKEKEKGLSDLSDEELKGKSDGYRNRIAEETADLDRDIEEIRSKMDSHDEEITLEERRALSDSLDDLEAQWLERVEE